MAGEKIGKQKIFITVAAVCFILAGARAANQPAGAFAVPAHPVRLACTFTTTDGLDWDLLSGSRPLRSFPGLPGIRAAAACWIHRPLLFMRNVMLAGQAGTVRIENGDRKTVARVMLITCPGLPWDRLMIRFVIHRG